MQAIQLTQYGPPNRLEIREVPKPVPKDDEVLVRIRSASINDWDCGLVRGKPFITRMFFGLKKPSVKIPGVDIAGVVVAVGGDVRSFKAGDEVYCDLSECGFGGFAEYVCVTEKTAYRKPSGISFNEAAALPHAGLLALQGLVDSGSVKPGDSVLINGAGGGVGTLAVQILKPYNVTVTGVDSGEKLEKMKSLGYDNVIDYKTTDFAQNDEKYDLILDTKSTRSAFKCARSLKKNGRYITIGGSMYRLFGVLILGSLISLFTRKKLRVLFHQPNKGIDRLTELAEKGHIKPAIDGPYAFEKIPELIQYLGEGRHFGKIVVEMGD